MVHVDPPNELVFTFGGSYVSANFGENRSRNATVRVETDEHTRTANENVNSRLLCRRKSVCLSVCNVRTPYSVEIFGDVSTPFCTFGHPLKSI